MNEVKYDNEQVRKVGQYILGETLGKGGYSWVKKGTDENTKVSVALKFMTRAEKSYEKEQANQVRTEIKSLMRIKNVNVMKLYAYNLNCQYPAKSGAKFKTILLVLEYCPGGELFDILYYTNQLDPITARTYFLQMLKALKACHDAGIVHRDIKPQNLLLDGYFQLKLSDFGLSFLGKEGVESSSIVMNTHYVGTRGYQAPELLKREPYTKACDIFSAGVVLFILLTGYPPFEQAIKTDKWFHPLYKGNRDKFWEQHKGCGIDDNCKWLLSKMMAYRPHERPTLEQVLNHPWVIGEEAKVHRPRDLAKVLKSKHRETRKRRRRDKKKMTDMQNSIRHQRRKPMRGSDMSGFPVCPRVNPQDYVRTWMSFTTKAKYLEEAYWLARNVCDIAFMNQTWTNKDADPWMITSVISLRNQQGTPYDYVVQIKIVELCGLEKYSFAFSRLEGDPLNFVKVWSQIESYMLAIRSADGKHWVFEDYEDDYASYEDAEEEQKSTGAYQFEDKGVTADVDGDDSREVVTAEAGEKRNG